MDLDNILDKNHLYYHCCVGGVVYFDKEYKVPVLDLKELTGDSFLPRALEDYNITSGYCQKHYFEVLEVLHRK